MSNSKLHVGVGSNFGEFVPMVLPRRNEPVHEEFASAGKAKTCLVGKGEFFCKLSSGILGLGRNSPPKKGVSAIFSFPLHEAFVLDSSLSN